MEQCCHPFPLSPWQCVFEFNINSVVHGLPHGSEADEDAGAGQQPPHKSNRHDHNYVNSKVLIAAVDFSITQHAKLKGLFDRPQILLKSFHLDLLCPCRAAAEVHSTSALPSVVLEYAWSKKGVNCDGA